MSRLDRPTGGVSADARDYWRSIWRDRLRSMSATAPIEVLTDRIAEDLLSFAIHDYPYLRGFRPDGGPADEAAIDVINELRSVADLPRYSREFVRRWLSTSKGSGFRQLVERDRIGIVRGVPAAPLPAFVAAAVGDWHCPPGPFRTPAQVELLAMNAAHARSLLRWPSYDKLSEYLAVVRRAGFQPAVRILLELLELAELDERPHRLGVGEFLETWRQSNFARVRISARALERLTAAGATSSNVAAPWTAWSLALPEPLPSSASILWVSDHAPRFALSRTNGAIRRVLVDPEGMGRLCSAVCERLVAIPNSQAAREPYRSASSTLDVDPLRQVTADSDPVADKDLRKYVRGAPLEVIIDDELAEEAERAEHEREIASRSPLKVRSLVGGHWKRQPCGPGRRERRLIRVGQYLRGPVDAPIVLRTTDVLTKVESE